MAGPILIVDDDPVQLRLLKAAVERLGYETLTATDGAAAMQRLEKRGARQPTLVILDLVMPELDGIEVLTRMRACGMSIPVIVQTAKGGIDTVISAMRAGAHDFIVKPVSSERLQISIANALKVEALEGEVKRIRRSASGMLTFEDLIGRSPAMEKVLRIGRKAAASNIPILIEGESGVGKEMVARAIQGTGERRTKPFVTVNCGAIPDNLVESILFGHEKGAFTGATEKHIGKFVEADKGTLFLDEIGDLPLDVQVKLLRAVQEGEADPVGARRSIRVDIRLISATNQDLLQQVKEGRFREDLFYRLNVFPIRVPPLRERREDIAILAHHFLTRFAAEESGGRVSGMTPQVIEMLCRYDWPGNIRQLENAVFRAVVLCEGAMLEVEDFPQIQMQLSAKSLVPHVAASQISRDHVAGFSNPAPAVPSRSGVLNKPSAGTIAPAGLNRMEEAMPGIRGRLRALDDRDEVRSLASLEKDLIELAIVHYRGRMSEVARKLGIGRSTLYRKLKEYHIDPPVADRDSAATVR